MRVPMEDAANLLTNLSLKMPQNDLLTKYISKNTAVVMYDFASQEDNELSLVCGQKIVVWRVDKGKLI